MADLKSLPQMLADLVSKLSLELSFVEPGKDSGRQVITALLLEIETLLPNNAAPADIVLAVRLARQWLDRLCAAQAVFDDPTVPALAEWNDWMLSALERWDNQLALPTLPLSWPPAASITATAPTPPTLVPVTARESIPAANDSPLAEPVVTPDVIDLILQGSDTLKTFIGLISSQLQGASDRQPIVVPTLQLIAMVKARLANPSGAVQAPAATAQPAPAQETHSTPAPIAATASTPTPIAAAAEVPAVAIPVAPAAPAAPVAASAPAAAGPANFIKVDTVKHDAPIDLVGELVISESMVVQDPEMRNSSSTNLARNLAQFRRITSELQRTTMSLRMAPIRATFQKMTSLVRDLSAKQNKQIQLVLSGEETELDRNIAEEISDPLIHMIRNAADHGVEKPEARIARGKPGLGTIHLRAFHRGGKIVIQIQDDGNGLNKEKLLTKAREKDILKTLLDIDRVVSSVTLGNLVAA